MQIKIAFGAIFLVDRGISRGRNRKVHPKTPRALSGTPQSKTDAGRREYPEYYSGQETNKKRGISTHRCVNV